MGAGGRTTAPAVVHREVEALARTGADVGLPRAFVAAIEWPGPAIGERIDPTLVATRGFPVGWDAADGGRDRFGDDYIYRASLGTTLPIPWTCRAEGGVAAGLSLTDAERRYAGRLDRWGLRSGVTVPVHLPGARLLAVTLACPLPDLPVPAAAAVDALLVRAHLAAGAVVDALPRRARAAVALTAREADCLALAAEGLTDAGIAARLGCAAGTVRVHLKRARVKLGARTRAQAVATAVATGSLPRPPG